MTITEFLLARIAEDEEASSRLRVGMKYPVIMDAGRARREVATKRLLAELHRPIKPAPCHCGEEHIPRMPDACRECGEMGLHDGDMAICDTLSLLASIYADHPDYNDAWRATPSTA